MQMEVDARSDLSSNPKVVHRSYGNKIELASSRYQRSNQSILHANASRPTKLSSFVEKSQIMKAGEEAELPTYSYGKSSSVKARRVWATAILLLILAGTLFHCGWHMPDDGTVKDDFRMNDYLGRAERILKKVPLIDGYACRERSRSTSCLAKCG